MKYTLTIQAKGCEPRAIDLPKENVVRTLLTLAGGTNEGARTNQAMMWNDTLVESGQVVVHKEDGTTVTIARVYDSEIPSWCEAHNLEDAEPQMLDAALWRMKSYNRVKSAVLIIQKRVPLDAPANCDPGWCEYIMTLHWEEGGSLTVGVLQRKPGAQIEFHT